VKNKSVRNLGIFWLVITPIALLFAGLSAMIDTAGKSVWFEATQLFWFCAWAVYLICGLTAITWCREEKSQIGVKFAVTPFFILALQILTLVIYW